MRIKFVNEDDESNVVLKDIKVPLHINGYTIYDSPLKKPVYNKLFLEFNKYLRENTIVESYIGQKEQLAWQHVFDLQEIKDLNISEDVRDMLLKVTDRKYKNTQESETSSKSKRKSKVDIIKEEASQESETDEEADSEPESTEDESEDEVDDDSENETNE